jgi:hypothetical protein
MLRRIALSFGAATLALSMATATALAGNPSGTGQPSVECGEDLATGVVPGFQTGGFANAEDRYANDDSTGGLASGNWHVVSQYDVACYQTGIH